LGPATGNGGSANFHYTSGKAPSAPLARALGGFGSRSPWKRPDRPKL
jgi:hypothetical protein